MPAVTTAITTTAASASTEAKVPYHLFHVLASRESAPTIDKICLQEERTGRSKKAMLLIVARFLTARQGDLCGTDTQVARVFGARISGDAPDRVSVPDDVHQRDGFF